MNSTVHGTMGSSPYEIAFGQPPHGTVFPGAVGSVNEEDVEELLVGGNEESSCVGRDQDRSAAFQHANRVEGSCEQVMSLGETTAIDSSTSDEESRLRREEEFRLDIGEGNFVHDFSDQASGEEEEEEEEVEEEDVPVLGKHTAVRRAANLRYCANAEKLLNKFSAAKRKRIAVFALGDMVSVKIPGIDRVGADALRVPGKIVEVCKGDLFRIRTASGVLGSCFRHDCLELFRGECAILVDGWRKEPVVSLREAARIYNRGVSGVPASQCNCSTGCTNRKCRVTAGTPCTSACHAGKACKNTHEQESQVILDEPRDSPVIENIRSGEQLTDDVIGEACRIMALQFPAMCGLHPPALLKVPGQAPGAVGECLQVHHVNHGHWVCSYVPGRLCKRVYIVDSIVGTRVTEITSELSELYGHMRCGKLETVCMQVQSGTSDCGLFAIAAAVEIATNGLDRSIKSMRRSPWSQGAMRERLATCLKSKMIAPFPRCLNRPAA